jgi:hypothetical protein
LRGTIFGFGVHLIEVDRAHTVVGS